VTKFAAAPHSFERLGDIFKFLTLAAFLSTAVSATIGVTSLSLAGFADWRHFGLIWRTWWLGDALGDIVIAPVLMLWSVGRSPRWKLERVVEGVFLLMLLFVVGQSVFGLSPFFGGKNYSFEIVSVPIILWTAFRFEQRETATSTLILTAIAVWGTLQGMGPFAGAQKHDALLLVQLFCGVTALMALCATAVVTERRRLLERLQSAQKTLKSLSGLLSICAWCKRIRDANGDWREAEAYINENSDADFTHGICPACLTKRKPPGEAITIHQQQNPVETPL
jgi:integral membrane sensor domain MASE1